MLSSSNSAFSPLDQCRLQALGLQTASVFVYCVSWMKDGDEVLRFMALETWVDPMVELVVGHMLQFKGTTW